MKRRILSLILTVVMLLSLTSIPVFAAGAPTSGVCGDNLTWKLDSEGTLTISGTGEMWDYASPEEAPWSKLLSKIVDVVIDEGVTSLGKNALSAGYSIDKLIIPSTLEIIRSHALKNAYPDCLYIAAGANNLKCEPDIFDEYNFCSAIELLVAEEGVSTVPTALLRAANMIDLPSSISNISLPDGYWDGDTYIYYRGTIEQWEAIGGFVPYGAKLYTDVVEYDKFVCLDSKGTLYIYDDRYLTPGDLPWAAYKDTAKSVVIERFRDIGEDYFKDFTEMKSIYIPVMCGERISENAFANCTALKDVYYSGNENTWTRMDISAGNESLKNAQFHFYDTLTWSVRNDTLYISGNGPMMDYIDSKGGAGTAITTPWADTSYSRVVIEDNVTKLGRNAFVSVNLSSAYIGKNVAEIDPFAFTGCKFSEGYIIDPENKTFEAVDGVLFNEEKTKLLNIPKGLFSDYEVPMGTQIIGEYCVEYSINSITLPESVTTIEAGAFFNESLYSVTLPKTVNKIGYYAWFPLNGTFDIYYGGTEEDWNNIEFVENWWDKSLNTVDFHTHDYASEAIAPTCTENGYTTHTCECGDSYKDSTVAATGHKWDDGEVTKEPTTAAEGEKTFTCTVCGETKTEKISKLEPSVNPFVDVAEKEYYFKPVMWAVSNGVTSGLSATTFAPAAGCTRAQVVTFLWRAAGEPAPKSSINPFKDVAEGQYYYDAVLWAVENGITTGLSADTFGPNTNCNRGQIVTFLWRAKAEPVPESETNPFADVAESQYYYDAVLWAVEKGITTGTSANSFAPNATCTRGQIVTFLYRAYI